MQKDLFAKYLSPEDHQKFLDELDMFIAVNPNAVLLLYTIMTLPSESLEEELTKVFSDEVAFALADGLRRFRKETGITVKDYEKQNTSFKKVATNYMSREQRSDARWKFVEERCDPGVVPIVFDKDNYPIIFFEDPYTKDKDENDYMYRYTEYLAECGLIMLN